MISNTMTFSQNLISSIYIHRVQTQASNECHCLNKPASPTGRRSGPLSAKSAYMQRLTSTQVLMFTEPPPEGVKRCHWYACNPCLLFFVFTLMPGSILHISESCAKEQTKCFSSFISNINTHRRRRRNGGHETIGSKMSMPLCRPRLSFSFFSGLVYPRPRRNGPEAPPPQKIRPFITCGSATVTDRYG